MTTFASDWCLAEFNRMARRPASDAVTDATKYGYLTLGQREVLREIGVRYPDALYATGGAVTLTTSDNAVYTFGTDTSGNAVAPLGYVGIYRSLNDIPDNPLVEGIDYLDEGTQIRIPNNRTGPATLYARYIASPDDIDASHQPVLRPAEARILLVIKAVERFAEDNRDYDLATLAQNRWAREFPIHLLAMRTRFRRGDDTVVRTDPWGGATGMLG